MSLLINNCLTRNALKYNNSSTRSIGFTYIETETLYSPSSTCLAAICDVPQNKDNEATCNILITVSRVERFPGSTLTHFGQEHNV